MLTSLGYGLVLLELSLLVLLPRCGGFDSGSSQEGRLGRVRPVLPPLPLRSIAGTRLWHIDNREGSVLLSHAPSLLVLVRRQADLLPVFLNILVQRAHGPVVVTAPPSSKLSMTLALIFVVALLALVVDGRVSSLHLLGINPGRNTNLLFPKTMRPA